MDVTNKRKLAVAAAVVLGGLTWWTYRELLARNLSQSVLDIASDTVFDHGCAISMSSFGLDTYSPFATLRNGKAVLQIDWLSLPVDFTVTGSCVSSQCDVSVSSLGTLLLKKALDNCGAVDADAMKEKILEAVQVLAASRAHVTDFYSQKGQWPSTLEEMGYGPMREGITFHVNGQGSSGQITADVAPGAVSNFQGGKLVMETKDGGQNWNCYSPDIRGKFLPGACRP